jgi:hypothetical protein
MGKTFRRDNDFRMKNSKLKKNKKLSKVNKPYLNKGGKVRNYQDEVDNEY